MEVKNLSDVHIGREIKTEMDRQGRKVTWLADQLHCDRTNIYKIFEKKSVDSLQLARISQALGVDLWQVYE